MAVTISGTSGVTFNGGSTLNPDNTMPSYACRAWVNFNGTGTTGTNQTIRSSGNVASVLKNGTGDYTITFTTSMPDANYNYTGSGRNTAGTGGVCVQAHQTVAPTSSALRIETAVSSSNARTDMTDVCISIFR